MRYKIRYTYDYHQWGLGGNISYTNKDIFCIFPLAPKDILLKSPKDAIIICISNNPLNSYEYYNLKKNSIIFTSIFPEINHTKEIMDKLLEKKIIIKLIRDNVGKVNHNYLNNSWTKISINLDEYSNITYVDKNIINKINDILLNNNYPNFPSTGYMCLMDIFLQYPKNVYINGMTFFVSKFSPNNKIYHNRIPNNHSTRKEFDILKSYLLQKNTICDKNLTWILNGKEDAIPIQGGGD